MDIAEMGNSISIIGGADGPTSIFIAGKINIGIIIAGIVIGLIICFFGLKLVKVIAGLLGFIIGASAGAAIAAFMGIEGIGFVVIAIVGAVILAVLSFLVYRIGVFFMTFICAIGVLIGIFSNVNTVVTVILTVVSLILAILAAVFVDPVIIIITGLCGGLSAGPLVMQLAGMGEPVWIGYVVGVVLAVLGMWVQFIMHSRKIGKEEKVIHEKARRTDSRESEIEKARMILDEEDEE